ncbi:MAG: ADP-ribosylglycohydrolase family protein [Planctomycetota bacterium]
MGEPTLKSLLRSRFRATLLGGAIGDALGFPFEGYSSSFMAALGNEATQQFVRHRSGYFPAGQYSDDTQLTLATVEALLEQRGFDGAAIARHFVPLWRDNLVVGRGRATSEAIDRLLNGTADWQTSGAEEGRAGNGAAMRAAPFGLLDFDDTERLIEHAVAASRITHKDPLAVAGAVAIAAAVAYNLTHRDVILGEFLDCVGGATRGVDARFANYVITMPRLLSLREEAAVDEISTTGLDGPYRESGDGIAPFVVPSVLIALYHFLRTPHDFRATVRGCLYAGGDVDTTTALAGAVSGALNGEAALPQNLVESLQDAARIRDLADQLHELKTGGRRLAAV